VVLHGDVEIASRKNCDARTEYSQRAPSANAKRVVVGSGSFRKRRKREIAVRQPRCAAVLAAENVRIAYASGDSGALVSVSESCLTGVCASMCVLCSVSALVNCCRALAGWFCVDVVRPGVCLRFALRGCRDGHFVRAVCDGEMSQLTYNTSILCVVLGARVWSAGLCGLLVSLFQGMGAPRPADMGSHYK
jgi:hypothetical protein